MFHEQSSASGKGVIKTKMGRKVRLSSMHIQSHTMELAAMAQ